MPAGCPLTNRQLEVIALAARGMAYKEIGSELGISRGTVSTHVHDALTALGVTGRRVVAAVVVLKERGWLGLQPPAERPAPAPDPRMTPQQLAYVAAFTRLCLERSRECEQMVTLAWMLLCMHTGFRPARPRRTPDIDELLLRMARGCMRPIPT